ncbi:MAG: hypothetical protein ACRCVX_11515 [Shewanella sp.]
MNTNEIYAKEFNRFDNQTKGFIALDMRATPGIVYCNHSFARLLDDRVDRLVGCPVDDITVGRKPFADFLSCYIADGKEFCSLNEGNPITFLTADGHITSLVLTELELIPCSQGNVWAMNAHRASALATAKQWGEMCGKSNPELMLMLKAIGENRKLLAGLITLMITISKQAALKDVVIALAGIFSQ